MCINNSSHGTLKVLVSCIAPHLPVSLLPDNTSNLKPRNWRIDLKSLESTCCLCVLGILVSLTFVPSIVSDLSLLNRRPFSVTPDNEYLFNHLLILLRWRTGFGEETKDVYLTSVTCWISLESHSKILVACFYIRGFHIVSEALLNIFLCVQGRSQNHWCFWHLTGAGAGDHNISLCYKGHQFFLEPP